MTPVPLTVRHDPALGGRWTSLTGGGREWLWHRPEPARALVRPGDPFVDTGGLEECLPTVRGTPDHGDVWSRRWRSAGPATAAVDTPDFTLTRRITDHAGIVTADYRLTAAPGYRFIWAAHALLDLSGAARLDAPPGTRTRLYPDPEPPFTGPWPAPGGVPLDHLGPDDGTAVGAVLLDCPEVTVIDGDDRLRFTLECDGQPRSVALWRNLRGWPAHGPYRSIGVEPMLGGGFDITEDVPTAQVPAGGLLRWRLHVSASRDMPPRASR
ncbi:hypothetical protein Daura_22785 [Dactylosporangium aurantiacum]|uniref:Galactose mutarotase n=1 Tax=Dactylosporangium aurantiacum TaxID=35754 RepID=A0A9Q9IPC4_9ACTN|nr:hypothetical protein [Dactylosporangium aurantiacum]MDG6107663.1 hypothetical protein [Dactylosporangium aurantiacum]UWZ58743.1 hypothetical protein Daura_22785 [Dactylosporangium aurantiacum]